MVTRRGHLGRRLGGQLRRFDRLRFYRLQDLLKQQPVLSLGDREDPSRIAEVCLQKPLSKPCKVRAHDGVRRGIEVLVTIEDLEGQLKLSDPV